MYPFAFRLLETKLKSISTWNIVLNISCEVCQWHILGFVIFFFLNSIYLEKSNTNTGFSVLKKGYNFPQLYEKPICLAGRRQLGEGDAERGVKVTMDSKLDMSRWWCGWKWWECRQYMYKAILPRSSEVNIFSVMLVPFLKHSPGFWASHFQKETDRLKGIHSRARK